MAQIILLSTPIGNLSDLTLRVKEVLAEHNGPFFVEDTREFKKLCQLLGLSSQEKQVFSFHDQDRSHLKTALDFLRQGRDIYLLSDSGSPLISDPAFPLVREALEDGHDLTTYPGTSSVIAALELSGLPPHPFIFHGFLPRDRPHKAEFFRHTFALTQANSTLGLTHIAFDSPHRIADSIDVFKKEYEVQKTVSVDIALSREITKMYESTYRFSLDEWENEKEKISVKGECVLVFHMRQTKEEQESPLNKELIIELAQECLNSKAHPKAVSKLVGEILNLTQKDVYNQMKR